MKILSWNVAGLRARLKNCDFKFLYHEKIDIVCLQETKCTQEQIKLPEELINNYSFRYWNSSDGTSQRNGLSGTTIWCNIEPVKYLETPEFDNEGRIIALEFKEFILINVYVPNSQSIESVRFLYREQFNNHFIKYVEDLKKSIKKEVIICGDMNVALSKLDVNNSDKKLNKVAGHYLMEINSFEDFLTKNKLYDIFRLFNSDKRISTYWSNFLKQERCNTNGWRIDYILITKNLIKLVKNLKICDEVMSSDHCPIYIEF